jgi:hypothetical protein
MKKAPDGAGVISQRQQQAVAAIRRSQRRALEV